MSKNADIVRKLRADAVARGLCMTCRIRRPREGVKTCDVCLGGKKDIIQAHRARGRCRCGASIAGRRFRQCSRCRRADRLSYRRRRDRLSAVGMCLIHPSVPVALGHTRCSSCLDKMAERARARERAQKVATGGSVELRRCSACGSTEHNLSRHERISPMVRRDHDTIAAHDQPISCSTPPPPPPADELRGEHPAGYADTVNCALAVG